MTPSHRLAAGLLTGTALAALALGGCSTPAPGAHPRAAAFAPAPEHRVAVPAGVAPSGPAATVVDPAAVPWSQVGPGWTAVATTGHPNAGPRHDVPVGPVTVALVSPTGHRWPVGSSASAVVLQDVSPDGSHVLAVRYEGSSSEVVELDTRHGTWRDVAPGLGLVLAQYTLPTAQQIWVGRSVAGTGVRPPVAQRLDRAGRVTLQLPLAGLVPTADGTRFVDADHDGVDVHDNATGAVVRTVAEPAGYDDCVARRPWSGSVVSAWCQSEAPGGPSDVLLLDTTTGRWSALTHAVAGDPTAPTGYDDAWPVAGGAVVRGAVGCGAGPTGLLDDRGRTRSWMSWPGAEQSPDVVGVAGTSVVARYSTCTSDGAQLAAQDVATHRVTVLARAPWLSAVVVPSR